MSVCKQRKYLVAGAAVLCGLSVLFALFGWLPLLNALLIPGFAVTLYSYARLSHGRLLHQGLWLATFLLGLLVATYRPADFQYPLIISVPFLHEGGAPFLLHLNLAKALAGWTLVGLLFIYRPMDRQPPWVQRPVPQWGLVGLVVAAVILFAQSALELAWVPKLPGVTLVFIMVNVGITCVAEEAFFRLLLQRHLAELFESRLWQLSVPVAVAAVLFAVTHRLALDALFVVYLIAGTGYALVYALTQRFSAAVAVHAGVNIAHFLLLPYPLLVSD